MNNNNIFSPAHSKGPRSVINRRKLLGTHACKGPYLGATLWSFKRGHLLYNINVFRFVLIIPFLEISTILKKKKCDFCLEWSYPILRSFFPTQFPPVLLPTLWKKEAGERGGTKTFSIEWPCRVRPLSPVHITLVLIVAVLLCTVLSVRHALAVTAAMVWLLWIALCGLWSVHALFCY